MKLAVKYLCRFTVLPLLLAAVAPLGHADTITHSGTFGADNSSYTYNFNLSSTQTVTLYTTSYGGGANLDGTTSAGGGFVPVLSLFTRSGSIIGGDGGSGVCNAGQQADSSTGRCEDAFLSELLAPGKYTLVLTEFPNVAVGDLSDGFLFSSDPTATGDACGGTMSGKKFFDTTAAPCVKRTHDYTLNIATNTPVPEPPTWALVLPAAGLIVAGRRYLA